MTIVFRSPSARRLVGAALLLLATLLGAPMQATAQPSESSDQIARAHFLAATGYFDTGDYESALREFERAYALTQYPQLLYNLYACHERLGQLQPCLLYTSPSPRD